MTARQISVLKFVVFLLALMPVARLVVQTIDESLGNEAIEAITRLTGAWTFNFLLLTLAVTPLRRIANLPWLIRLRRMLGLFAFFYASLHFMTFVALDHSFDPAAIAKDVFKRPFVTVGFAAFLLLIPLALTSSNAAVRRMGGKRWQKLHYTIYPIGILAAIHYFWLSKPEALLYPLIYAVILAALLGWRARERMRRFDPFPGPASQHAAEQVQLPKTAVIKFMPRPPRD